MEKIKRKSHEIDMTDGGLFGKILLFALPLLATSVLQLLFNSADMVVVGRFDSENAMGAVGATASLNHLIISLVLGTSVGAGVVLSNAFGARDKDYGDRILHTSMIVALAGGILMGGIGFFLTPYLLRLMGTLELHYEMSKTYLQIIMLGTPFNMLYNFGASILRATGDTKRPLIYLTVSGIVNVVINIILVAGFKMGVAGVAIATITSQAVSAVLIVITLLKSDGFVKLSFKRLKVDKRAFKEIIRLGIPTGIQSGLFSVSNVFLQTAINSFGIEALNNGNAISAQIEGYVGMSINSVSNTSLTVVGQNYGAGKIKRIRRTVIMCLLLGCGVGIVFGWSCILLHKPLCKLFMDSASGDAALQAEIIMYALKRMIILCGTYFIVGIMEIFSFGLRALGKSFTSMLIVLVGTCFFRIFWIYCIFPLNKDLTFLMLLYPISWGVTALICAIIFYEVLSKKEKTRLEIKEKNEEKIIV